MPFFDAIRIGASGAADTAYTVERSLRFNRSDSAHLTYTPASASSDRTKVTISAWVKKCGINEGEYMIAHAGTTNDNRAQLRFYTSSGFDNISFAARVSGSWILQLDTTAKFRDPSAWYHIVARCDTTNGTANIYINGVEETSFTTSTKPSGSQSLEFFNNSEHQIGQRGYDNTGYMNGYMAEINVIQGQALDASYFGETDAITGQWNPKKYTGGYGDGFYLNFSDNSGTSATTLGKDSSGNGNNFTPNNFSVAAGLGNDSMKDTPTNNFSTFNAALPIGSSSSYSNGNLEFNSATSSQRQTRSTFAHNSGKWYAEIRLDSYSSASGSYPYIGVAAANTFDQTWVGAIGTAINTAGTAYINGSSTSGGFSYTSGDIIGIAMDVDNLLVYFYKNGTIQNSGSGYALTSDSDKGYQFAVSLYASSGTWAANLGGIGIGSYSDANGHGNFTYSVPSGYLAECSANLSDPTILLPNKHFDTLLYTGTGSSQNITGLEFQPDWVWIKKRSNSENHELQDAVRGATKRLASNTTDAESTVAGSISAFNSDGFTVVDAGTTNENGNTYVGWNWNAGDTDSKTYTVTVVDDSGNKYRFDGFAANAVTLDLAEGGTYVFNYPSAHPLRFSTTADGTHGGGSEYTTGVTHNSSTQTTFVVPASAPNLYYYCSNHSGMGGFVRTNIEPGSSNFDGTIISDLKVNQTAGFSIAAYTGNGTSGATIGHGLGVKPSVIICKCRNVADNWIVYHQGLNGGVDPEDYYIFLNSTAADVDSPIMLNDTAPTSSVITFQNDSTNNLNGRTYVMYCFSGVEGYSKFGSYTGNGNADGTFVFTGFSPALIITKRSGGTSNWYIWDPVREGNVMNSPLQANDSGSEPANYDNSLDILSNGFKLRATNAGTNGSNESYLYMAFAESPFKNARAR